MNIGCIVCKTEEDNERIFKGILTAEMVDRDGEITLADEVMKVLPIWFDSDAPITDNHTNRIVGKGLSYRKVWVKSKSDKVVDGDNVEVYDEKVDGAVPAIEIVGKIYNRGYELDDKIWEAIKNGQYRGLSFGGATRSGKVPITLPDGRIGFLLKDLEQYEVAVCEKPAVPFAVITNYNKIAKSEGYELMLVTKPEDKRPPKEFWDACVSRMRSKYDNPEEVCGGIFWSKLGGDRDKAREMARDLKEKSDDELKSFISNESVNKYMVDDNMMENGKDKEKEEEEMVEEEKKDHDYMNGDGDVKNVLVKIMESLNALNDKLGGIEKALEKPVEMEKPDGKVELPKEPYDEATGDVPNEDKGEEKDEVKVMEKKAKVVKTVTTPRPNSSSVSKGNLILKTLRDNRNFNDMQKKILYDEDFIKSVVGSDKRW